MKAGIVAMWRNDELQIEAPNSTHAYYVEIEPADVRHVYVLARNRNQAAALTRKFGYEVRSVNMLG